jgi:TM2 domain-containing membrane protein YozV
MSSGRRLDGKPVPLAKTDYITLSAAYLLLVIGGTMGLHLAYLGRQYQAVVWSTTLGMFGFGVLRDIFTIPRYVREANGDESEQLTHKLCLHCPTDASVQLLIWLICKPSLLDRLCRLSECLLS